MLADTEPEKGDAVYDWDAFSKEQIYQAEEFLDILEKQIRPEAAHLKSSIVINQMKIFSEQLLEIAQKHRVEPLLIFSQDLWDAVELFDITAIERQMERLPALLDKIEHRL